MEDPHWHAGYLSLRENFQIPQHLHSEKLHIYHLWESVFSVMCTLEALCLRVTPVSISFEAWSVLLFKDMHIKHSPKGCLVGLVSKRWTPFGSKYTETNWNNILVSWKTNLIDYFWYQTFWHGVLVLIQTALQGSLTPSEGFFQARNICYWSTFPFPVHFCQFFFLENKVRLLNALR